MLGVEQLNVHNVPGGMSLGGTAGAAVDILAPTTKQPSPLPMLVHF